jgi:hypothetical protein
MEQYSPEIQKALAKARKVKAAHEHELLKLPGVHSVSVQPKTTKGKRTTEFAIVVQVVKKKTINELGPDEAIPAVIESVKTDVVESPARRTLALPSKDTDDNHYPHVLGGAEIVSDGLVKTEATSSNAIRTQFTISRTKGTLGCVAINQAAADARKKAVALTNAHVVLDLPRTTTHDGSAVGQPDTSSLCCKSLDHTIGHMDQDAVLIAFDENANPQPPPTGVDAAFVTLDPETEWAAEVIASGQGDSITTEKIVGAHTVTSSEALFDFSSGSGVPIYAVHKRGIRTGLTKGWLISINATDHTTYETMDGSIKKKLKLYNQLEIQPQDPTKFFSLEGDSGSVLLNDKHEVIGLIFSGPADTDPPSTTAIANPIGEVQTKLGVVVADSAAFPGVQKVPKSATAHAFAALPAERTVLHQHMETARAELGSTEIGSQLDSALHLHFTEIRLLVNKNKRAAVIWKRIEGAAWINEILTCLLDRGRPLPAQLRGQTLDSCLDQLARVLTRYGSKALVEDLTRFAPVLRALAGRTYDQTLDTWRLQVAS